MYDITTILLILGQFFPIILPQYLLATTIVCYCDIAELNKGLYRCLHWDWHRHRHICINTTQAIIQQWSLRKCKAVWFPIWLEMSDKTGGATDITKYCKATEAAAADGRDVWESAPALALSHWHQFLSVFCCLYGVISYKEISDLWIVTDDMSAWDVIWIQNIHCCVRLGYCFTPYQRQWLYNGAPLVAFYDTLGIRRMYFRLKPPASSRGALLKRVVCVWQGCCFTDGTHHIARLVMSKNDILIINLIVWLLPRLLVAERTSWVQSSNFPRKCADCCPEHNWSKRQGQSKKVPELHQREKAGVLGSISTPQLWWCHSQWGWCQG